MSRRRDIERQLRGLGEIGEIMTAMRNLALMETRKLQRFLQTQQRVVASIRAAAEDFGAFHGAAEGAASRELLLAIGSERGFCGDFNEAVAAALAARPGAAEVVAVGSKLSSRLAAEARVTARLEGPGTLDEVPGVLLRLMETLLRPRGTGALRLTVLHHDAGGEGVVAVRLDPFAKPARARPAPGYPPRLDLEPRRFAAALAEHYLFAAMHGVFYSSLMAENQRRMQHMELAVRRIEQRSADLQRRRNSLRQEEITEEIEIIMLNAAPLPA
jgi:F-type H+-transporting ATPase subunit gamma